MGTGKPPPRTSPHRRHLECCAIRSHFLHLPVPMLISKSVGSICYSLLFCEIRAGKLENTSYPNEQQRRVQNIGAARRPAARKLISQACGLDNAASLDRRRHARGGCKLQAIRTISQLAIQLHSTHCSWLQHPQPASNLNADLAHSTQHTHIQWMTVTEQYPEQQLPNYLPVPAA